MASSPSADGIAAAASVSTLAQLSVGLTVCPQNGSYFVTAYRCVNQRDEERVSFDISREHFLEFADTVAVLADAERSGAEEGTDADSAGPAGGRGAPVWPLVTPSC